MSALQQNIICYRYSEQIYFKVATMWEPGFSAKISSRQNFSLEQSTGTKYRKKITQNSDAQNVTPLWIKLVTL